MSTPMSMSALGCSCVIANAEGTSLEEYPDGQSVRLQSIWMVMMSDVAPFNCGSIDALLEQLFFFLFSGRQITIWK